MIRSSVIVSLLSLTFLFSAGCAGFFDLTYAISDKKRHESKQERTPTEQTVTADEFDLQLTMPEAAPASEPVPAFSPESSSAPVDSEVRAAPPAEVVPVDPYSPYPPTPTATGAPPLAASTDPYALPPAQDAPPTGSNPPAASPQASSRRALLTLRCTTRTRAVERSWTVSKTYGYRGGWERGAYLASMAGDLLVGGIIAGAAAGMCTSDERDTSCLHMLWASPWAIDLLYAAVRQGMVRKPVLERKSKHDSGMRLGVQPLQEDERSCEGTQLWLGVTDGTSEEQRITEGFVRERRFRGEPLAVPIAPDGSVVFDESMARAWLASSSVAVWAVQNGNEPTKVRTDLCVHFQPFLSRMTTLERDSFSRRCSQLRDVDGNWTH